MPSGSDNKTPSTSTEILDRILWNFVGFSLLILILINFMRYPDFDAFVDLESDNLELEFRGGDQFEQKLIEFDKKTIVVDIKSDSQNLEGAVIDQISTTTSNTVLNLTGIDSERAELCLGKGAYVLATRRGLKFRSIFLEITGDSQFCLILALSGPMLAFPDIISIKPHKDSRDVIVYPELSGGLRVRLTGKEVGFISGMSLRLAIEDETNPDQEEAIRLNFADGSFGINTWKRLNVMLGEGSNPKPYSFTPLDVLRKFMEENGLWYTLMFVIGAVFTLRKVLLLR